MSLLKVENVSHHFGDKSLYENASFELYKGEHVGIVGQNGAGKSTLIRILLAEMIPDEGSIKWQSNLFRTKKASTRNGQIVFSI
ncbi:ATP-binding cassette domain-containing protein [Paenibacillus assamensis]|uniref:ATP-binding cassette domain-containing protein n=1 Tax=Paenibacillus assamensis TaxID=311244 RepID=UPI000426CA91